MAPSGFVSYTPRSFGGILDDGKPVTIAAGYFSRGSRSRPMEILEAPFIRTEDYHSYLYLTHLGNVSARLRSYM